METGIDVSHHNGVIDWPKVAGAGYKFAYIKASQGGAFLDPKRKQNAKGAAAAGLKVGFYHFYEPNVDGKVQADMFLGAIENLPMHLPPCLDVEEEPSPWPSQAVTRARIVHWMRAVSAETGVLKLCIYTRADLWKLKCGTENGAEGVKFSDHILWLARYSTIFKPRVPRPWTRYHIWQHSEKGKVPGIVGNCDLNRWYA